MHYSSSEPPPINRSYPLREPPSPKDINRVGCRSNRMGVAGVKKEQALLFVLALALIAVLSLIIFSHADNLYILKIKGDGTTRVLTKDIRVGPVPFLFWGVLLLYTWLASHWSRIPIKKFLKHMVVTGLVVHQFLLLLQFELQYSML